MPGLIERPPSHFDCGGGLLRAEHFQVAWVTNDIERALRLFADDYGVRRFRRLDGPLAGGGSIRVELAWVGSTMYELIETRGPGAEIYDAQLPGGDGFAIRHHHYGFLVRDEADWRRLLAEVERQGRTIPLRNNTPGFLQYVFVEAPELGHYLEYLFPEPAGREFFEQVPAN